MGKPAGIRVQAAMYGRCARAEVPAVAWGAAGRSETAAPASVECHAVGKQQHRHEINMITSGTGLNAVV